MNNLWDIRTKDGAENFVNERMKSVRNPDFFQWSETVHRTETGGKSGRFNCTCGKTFTEIKANGDGTQSIHVGEN